MYAVRTLLGLLVVLCYGAVATAPCPRSAATAPQRSGAHAAEQAAGHRDHGAHHEATAGATVGATLQAPCPCGCGDLPASGGGTLARTGFAPRSSAPEPPPPPVTATPLSPVPQSTARLHAQPIEHVPVLS